MTFTRYRSNGCADIRTIHNVNIIRLHQRRTHLHKFLEIRCIEFSLYTISKEGGSVLVLTEVPGGKGPPQWLHQYKRGLITVTRQTCLLLFIKWCYWKIYSSETLSVFILLVDIVKWMCFSCALKAPTFWVLAPSPQGPLLNVRPRPGTVWICSP